MEEKKQKISQMLSAKYQDIQEKRLNQLTREVIYGPQNRNVNINGNRIKLSDLRYQLADTF